MTAVGIQQYRGATLPSIQREIAAKETDRAGPLIQLGALCNNEPAPREGVRPQPIITRYCHNGLPFCWSLLIEVGIPLLIKGVPRFL